MFGLMESGFQHLYWGNILMIFIGLGLVYLAVGKKMEPLLLVPIGFGIILVNLPLGGLMDYELLMRAPHGGIVTEVRLHEGDRFGRESILIIIC